MLELLPADLANALQRCFNEHGFGSERFNKLLATRPGLPLFRHEFIDDVYRVLVDQIDSLASI